MLLAVLLGCGPPPGAGMEALTGATVIDVVTGRALPNAVVLIRDARIVSLGSASELSIPRGASVTDLRGRWIIPGLIDAHTHLQPWGLATAVRYGVTTVRDLHDGLAGADTLRAAASRGVSPHLFLAGAMIDSPPTTYPDAIPVETTEQATEAVDRLARSGMSWIKTYTRVTPTLLESIVQAARPRRLPVAAHLGVTDARTAAMLGVSSIEHLSGVPEAAGDSTALYAAHHAGFFKGWTAFERSWTTIDTANLAEVAADLAAQGVVLVPTLVLHETFSRLDDSSLYHTPEMASVPDSARRNWNVPGMIRRAGWTRNDFLVFRAARDRQDFFVRTFVAAGGRIVAGTDASNQLIVPGAALHTEMELLVRAGMSAIDALRSATTWSAELLHAESLGRLRAGATADLIVLGANPLTDIRNSRDIVQVMLDGKWVAR